MVGAFRLEMVSQGFPMLNNDCPAHLFEQKKNLVSKQVWGGNSLHTWLLGTRVRASAPGAWTQKQARGPAGGEQSVAHGIETSLSRIKAKRHTSESAQTVPAVHSEERHYLLKRNLGARAAFPSARPFARLRRGAGRAAEFCLQRFLVQGCFCYTGYRTQHWHGFGL